MFFLWSHGFSMCSLQISVLFVSMRVEISLFSSGMLGCCGVFLLVQFLCLILLRMSCGRSLSVLRILPTDFSVITFFIKKNVLTPSVLIILSQTPPIC